jgi:hypothetical protein
VKEEEEGPFFVTLVAIDETALWNLDGLPNGHKVDRIMAVHLFDREQVTYCCEITPSRWLERLRTTVVLKDEFETDEELYDAVQEESMLSPDWGGYYHVSTVNRMLSKNPEDAYVDPHEYESFADAVEQHQCNHELY